MYKVHRIIFLGILYSWNIYTVLHLQEEKPRDVQFIARIANLLVRRAIEYLRKHDFEKACQSFMQDMSWRKGDITILLIRDDGTIIVDVEHPEKIWKNYLETNNPVHIRFFKNLRKRAQRGGGWTLHPHNNALHALYVEQIIKNGQKYFVTAGFYPENKQFISERLAENVIDFFQEYGIDATIKTINDGVTFRRGDINVSVFNEHGTLLADIFNNNQVGKNYATTANFIQFLTVARTRERKWFNTQVNSAEHIDYALGIQDPRSKKFYILVLGYYPHITEQKVQQTVTRAISLLKRAGREEAFKIFTDPQGDFSHGPLSLTILNLDGSVILQPPSGILGKKIPSAYAYGTLGTSIEEWIIQEVRATGKGWIHFIEFDLNHSVYFEKIEGPWGALIVLSGYYPERKGTSVRVLGETGVEFIRRQDPYRAFKAFSNPGPFIYGNLYLFVYDTNGICLVHGQDHELIWTKQLQVRDQQNVPVLPHLLSLGRRDRLGWSQFALHNAIRRIYVEYIDIVFSAPARGIGEKVDVRNAYLLGSGYYRYSIY